MTIQKKLLALFIVMSIITSLFLFLPGNKIWNKYLSSAAITTPVTIIDTGTPPLYDQGLKLGAATLPTQLGFARKFTLSQTTTLNQAKLYIASTVSTATFGYLSVVIYKDASDVPDSSQVSCLATNQYFTLPVGLKDWKSFTLSNCTLEPGNYWLAFEKRVTLDSTAGVFLSNAPSTATGKSVVKSSTAGATYVVDSVGGYGRGMQLLGTTTTIPTYSLTVTSTEQGTVTSSPAGIDCGTVCEKMFNEDTVVTLTATPRPGYRFSGWTGSCINTTGDCVVTMDAAKNVTATFGGIEVAHFSFDNTHDDTSGSNNNGIVTGATYSTTTKKIGTHALEFNGTSNYSTAGTTSSINVIKNAVTLSTWIYRPSGSNTMGVITQRTKLNTYLEYFILFIDANNKINWLVNPVGGSNTHTIITANTAITTNTWHHLVGTYDGATMKLYIDNVLVGSQTKTGIFADDTTPLLIGAGRGDAGSVDNYTEFYKGFIDEMRIYNYALSTTEIDTLYHQGDSITPTLPGSPILNNSLSENGQIKLSWNAPISNGGSEITEYIIEYKKTSDTVCSVFNGAISVTDRAATITGLENGTEYMFRVYAKNAIGESANPSNEVRGTPIGDSTVVNGTCGTTNNSCTTGTSVDVADSTTQYLWSCNGVNGGTNASCTLNKPINGTCGTASGKTYASTIENYGTDTQCTNGTPSNTNFPIVGGSITWTCSGQNGGTASTTCTANRGATPVNGTCGTTNNSCTTGTSVDVADSTTQYLWSCNGVNGGTNTSCTLNKPINGSCGNAATTYASQVTSYGTNIQCANGTPSSTTFPAVGSSVTWTCSGQNGGTASTTCTASRVGLTAHTPPARPTIPEQSGIIIASPDIVYISTASSLQMQVICTIGDTIKIYNTSSLLATKTCTKNLENISISAPEVEGVFSITATLSDSTHSESVPSERVMIFNDQTTRSAPGTPDLTDNSDTGIYNTDNITNNNKPQLLISCLSGNTVKIYESALLVGTGSCIANTALITINTSLSDGIHTFVAKQINPTTGATSGPSGNLMITIDTSGTIKSTPLSSSNITQTSARISWSPVTDAIAYMVYRNNTLITTTEQITLTDSGLTANTQYTYYISTKDIAGNTSEPSDILGVTTPKQTTTGGGGGGGGGGSSTPINGVCNPALTSFSTLTPTKSSLSGQKLCKAGNSTTVNYSSSDLVWTYTCRGTNGGTTDTCTVNAKLNAASNTNNNTACDLKTIKKLPLASCKLNSNSFINFHRYLSCLGVVTQQSSCETAGCALNAKRQELAAIAVRIREIPLESGYKCQKKHTDTSSAASWVCEVVEKAQTAELISATNKQFRPNDTMTRAEAYSVLLKSICIHPQTTSQNWQTEVAKTALKYGFTTRSVGNFEPNKQILRQELFVLAARVAEWKAKNPESCGSLPSELICK